MITNIPENQNFQNPIKFNLVIPKLPYTSYFAQSVNLPAPNLGVTEVPSPFKTVPIPGDHIVYNDLQVTFKIDEDWNSYKECYDWLIALGFPDNYDQYQEEDRYTDASIVALTNSNIANVRFDIKRMFITSLSDPIFDTRYTNIPYLVSTATFKFKSYTITKL
jgi:hypothetical protein